MVPSTESRESCLSRGTYMITPAPNRSPRSILPWRRPMSIFSRYLRTKYGRWIPGPTLESKFSSLEFFFSPRRHSHRRSRDDATDQDAVFKSQWQFNAKRGAVLLMHKPRLTRLPDAFFKAPQTLKLSILKGKFVVYQVWNCPGFYMYLSNRSGYSRASPLFVPRIKCSSY